MRILLLFFTLTAMVGASDTQCFECTTPLVVNNTLVATRAGLALQISEPYRGNVNYLRLHNLVFDYVTTITPDYANCGQCQMLSALSDQTGCLIIAIITGGFPAGLTRVTIVTTEEEVDLTVNLPDGTPNFCDCDSSCTGGTCPDLCFPPPIPIFGCIGVCICV